MNFDSNVEKIIEKFNLLYGNKIDLCPKTQSMILTDEEIKTIDDILFNLETYPENEEEACKQQAKILRNLKERLS